MHEPLALVADPDWAMRELMRRSLEQVGYSVVESSSSLQLDVALRTKSSRGASSALLVLSGAIALACQEVISTLGRDRVRAGLSLPHVLLTCEFGTLKTCPQLDFADCIAVGLLEKPFDFSLLQGIAFRCRTIAPLNARQVGSQR